MKSVEEMKEFADVSVVDLAKSRRIFSFHKDFNDLNDLKVLKRFI